MKKFIRDHVDIFLTLLAVTLLIWSYSEHISVMFLQSIILIISGIYILGLTRLWRSAGIGHGLAVWRAVCFLGGMSILAFTLSGPMDELSDHTLSIHMTQHMLLMKIIAPLLLLGEFSPIFLWGIGKQAAHWTGGIWTRSHFLNQLWQGLTNPWVAWTLYALCLWIWHAPLFYQAALRSEPIHDLEHALFLGTSLLFWWYVLKVGHDQAVRYGTVILYLFTTMLHETVLGALLTFSSTTWYSLYSTPDIWGLSPLSDQQIAGMIMWILGGMLLGFLIILYFGAWLSAIEKRAQLTHPELIHTGDANDS